MLMRIYHDELDCGTIDRIVLMAGTNNVGRDAPAQIAAGIARMVEAVRSRQPKARIKVIGNFARRRPAGTDRRNQRPDRAGDRKSGNRLLSGRRHLSARSPNGTPRRQAFYGWIASQRTGLPENRPSHCGNNGSGSEHSVKRVIFIIRRPVRSHSHTPPAKQEQIKQTANHFQ